MPQCISIGNDAPCLKHWQNPYVSVQFSQLLSRVWLCDSVDGSTPGFPVHYQLPELAQTHVHRVGDAIQPFHPLSSPSPPTSIFPSIRVFSKESLICIRWPKYWSFSFNISPSNEYSGLPISTVLQKIKTSHLFLSVIKTVSCTVISEFGLQGSSHLPLSLCNLRERWDKTAVGSLAWLMLETRLSYYFLAVLLWLLFVDESCGKKQHCI